METIYQKIYAVLSGNTLAFRLKKEGAHSMPGQIIESDNDLIGELINTVDNHDIDLSTTELRLAVVHDEFILKSGSVNDEDLYRAYKSKNLLWQNKNIHTKFYDKPGISCAFCLPSDIEDKIKDVFPSSEIHHSAPVLLYGISEGSYKGKNLFCLVSDQWITVAFIRDERIKYIKSFEFHYPEDALYFLKLAIDQADVSEGETTVWMVGRVERESQLTSLIKPYFHEVKFVGKDRDDFIFKDLSWLSRCV